MTGFLRYHGLCQLPLVHTNFNFTLFIDFPWKMAHGTHAYDTHPISEVDDSGPKPLDVAFVYE